MMLDKDGVVVEERSIIRSCDTPAAEQHPVSKMCQHGERKLRFEGVGARNR